MNAPAPKSMCMCIPTRSGCIGTSKTDAPGAHAADERVTEHVVLAVAVEPRLLVPATCGGGGGGMSMGSERMQHDGMRVSMRARVTQASCRSAQNQSPGPESSREGVLRGTAVPAQMTRKAGDSQSGRAKGRLQHRSGPTVASGACRTRGSTRAVGSGGTPTLTLGTLSRVAGRPS